MNEPTAVTAVTPIDKSVRISLTQVNKNGKQNASFIFSAKGEQLNDFLTDSCRKIVEIMKIQQRVKTNGGKSNAFGLTKSGEFEMGILVLEADEQTKLLNNFVFTLGQLGEQNPEVVLIDLVEGYKLLTE